MIKKLLSLTLSLMLLAGLAVAAQAEEKKDAKKDGLVKSGVKSVVSGTVSAGKDMVSGIVEGVDEGRREGDSADGAKVAASKDDLPRLGLTLEVTKVEFLDEEKSRAMLTVALRNPNEYPVRITNLTDQRNVVLLDKDGFSYALDQPMTQGKDVTALGRSATRLRYTFSGLEGQPDVFRFLDNDIKIQ